MDEYYDQKYYNNKSVIIDKNRLIIEKKRVALIKQYINKPNIKVLDVGCGPGFFLYTSSLEAWQCYGVDNSRFAVKEARQKSDAQIKRINLVNNSLPFENNFFDVVTSFDVIEHLKSDENYISEIYRVLNKGGIAILSTPDGESKYDIEPSHINIYSRNKILTKLKKNNFKILGVLDNRAYTNRLIPLRRFRIINWLNQGLCDLFGNYVKEIILIIQK